MALSPTETRELFERKCQLPTDQESIVDAVGDTAVVAPTGESSTVETILQRSAETEYESIEALHSTVMANLSDEHIGRKHYDDRSPNPARDGDVSF